MKGAIITVILCLVPTGAMTKCVESVRICELRAARQAERAAIQNEKCKRLGGVSIGMDHPAVEKSCWGKPDGINETLTAHGRHEQWVYQGGYLYFDSGKLTSIQTSR